MEIDKLEIGMYVRSRYGISKIEQIEDDEIFDNIQVVWKDGYKITKRSVIQTIDVIKANRNIIKLLEIGDYVNGEKIKYVLENSVIDNDGNLLEEQDIKSIVTKELFESMSYKLED